MKSYELDDHAIHEILERKKKKTNYFPYLMILALFIFVSGAVLMISKTNKMASSQDKQISATGDASIHFTEINTEDDYELYPGDLLSFSCSSENKNVFIEYVIDDLTTETRICNMSINPGENFEFHPSEYIAADGTHDIMITQNAYASNDQVMSNVLQSNYSQIKINIISDDTDTKQKGEE